MHLTLLTSYYGKLDFVMQTMQFWLLLSIFGQIHKWKEDEKKPQVKLE
jgi:hypothetical protein